MLRQSGSALGTAEARGHQAHKEPVDSITVGRAGLFGEKEEARIMPVLRLAAVKDDQVRGCLAYSVQADMWFVVVRNFEGDRGVLVFYA